MKVRNQLVVSLCFLGMLLQISSVQAAARKNPVQIVGGVEAAMGEFPYIVSLQTRSDGHFCGGSLIKKNWVLTAAHCTRGIKIDHIYIGLHDLSDTSQAEVMSPKKVIVHPQYKQNTNDYDFALIELDNDSLYEPVALNSDEITIPADGTEIMTTVAGWGTTSEGASKLPDLLQKVDVPLVTHESCNKSYYGQITDRMLCAGFPKGGKDSCQGDSGGPLVIAACDGKPELIGVVSWGSGCARAGLPGIYSKVNSVVPWIEKMIQ